MPAMEQQLERIREDADAFETVSGLAMYKDKRELFARLSAYLNILADEVERVLGHEALKNPCQLAVSRKDFLLFVEGTTNER